MKRYIALEDVDKPQTKAVTDVEICYQYIKKLVDKIFYIKQEEDVVPVVDWHDVIDLLDEMEREE